MRKFRFLMPIGFLAIVAGFSAVVMLLWNWLMPLLFGLVVISFWQALGLLVLCRILFGSFGGGHRMMFAGMMKGIHGCSPFHEKWTRLTPEQRKEFFNKRMEHLHRGGFFGGHFSSDENKPNEQDTP